MYADADAGAGYTSSTGGWIAVVDPTVIVNGIPVDFFTGPEWGCAS